jgi:DNA-binding NarL/FixJ family response regulator
MTWPAQPAENQAWNMKSTGEDIDLSRALIVEDDVATQQRLARLLVELPGTGTHIVTAGDIREAKLRIAECKPNLALVDIGLPDGSGIDLISWQQIHHPDITTVVISAWGHEDTVLAALRAGAVGYLLKEREDIELSVALQSIRRGGAPIDPFIARRILALLPGTPAKNVQPDESATDTPAVNDHALSERESEILQLVARGFSNREIAALTALSRFTIEGYTKSIYRKLAVNSRTAAVFEAKAMGLLH